MFVLPGAYLLEANQLTDSSKHTQTKLKNTAEKKRKWRINYSFTQKCFIELLKIVHGQQWTFPHKFSISQKLQRKW